jgi:peptidoglycan/xylan/chitin deacetylase (PgdA/CDA1 family)
MDRPTEAHRRGPLSLLVAGLLLAAAATPISLAALDRTRAAGSPAAGAAAAPGAQAEPALVAIPTTVAELLRDRPDDLSAAAVLKDPLPSAPSVACAGPAGDVKAARALSHGSRATKVVALTFDDGYGPTNTLRILSILERAHVNATFFPTGRAVELYPGVWREIAAAGFPIGDHTYSHSNLKGTCFGHQLYELRRQQHVVGDLLGIREIPLMRPPFGTYDRMTRYAATVAGDARVVLWDVDTRDWSGVSWRAVAHTALTGRSGSIILMHTMPGATARALTHIIAGYRARGFTFVTVGQLLGVNGPVPFG